MTRSFRMLAVLIFTVVGAGGVFARTAAIDPATPAAATPVPFDVQCGAFQGSFSTPINTDGCTLSPPWWTAWARCPVTPVHSEAWVVRNPRDQGLQEIPWVQAEPAASGLVAHLFYGNRPLHARNQFPDGEAAKVLWEYDHPVDMLGMTATNLWQPGSPSIALHEYTVLDTAEAPAAGPTPAPAAPFVEPAQIPSYVDIPSSGCWKVTLQARDANGPIEGSVVFIVIDG